MAFEANFEKVVSSVRKKVDALQSQVECKFSAEDGVQKILCSNAKANITNSEVSGRDIVYSGFVNFQVIYLNNDNETVSANYSAEFKEKYPMDRDLNNVVPIVSVNVVDVNVSVNGDMRVNAIIETVIDIVVNDSTMVLTNIDGASYYVKKETLKYANYVNQILDKFEIVNDVEIQDSVSRVLSVCPNVYIDAVETNDRYLTLKGGVSLNICYLTDNNLIRNFESNSQFSQEIAHDDLLSDSKLQNLLQILYNDIKVTTNIDTDSALVNIELPLQYQGYIFSNFSTEIVSDLFSTEFFTNIAVESVASLVDFDEVMFSEKLNGSVQIRDNEPFIDEILGVCCSSVVVANSVVNDGVLTVEGVATVSVAYLNKETNSTHTVEVEIPFSTSTAIELRDGFNTSPRLALTNITAKARRGKEIEVNVNLEVYSDVYNNMENVVITKINEEDEIPENSCAMSFYITREGDDVWSIAKSERVSPDVLLTQNPSLNDGVEENKRVVIYRQRQMEF